MSDHSAHTCTLQATFTSQQALRPGTLLRSERSRARDGASDPDRGSQGRRSLQLLRRSDGHREHSTQQMLASESATSMLQTRASALPAHARVALSRPADSRLTHERKNGKRESGMRLGDTIIGGATAPEAISDFRSSRCASCRLSCAVDIISSTHSVQANPYPVMSPCQRS